MGERQGRHGGEEKVRKEACDLGWVKRKSVWGQRIAGKLGILRKPIYAIKVVLRQKRGRQPGVPPNCGISSTILPVANLKCFTGDRALCAGTAAPSPGAAEHSDKARHMCWLCRRLSGSPRHHPSAFLRHNTVDSVRDHF